MVIVVLSLSSFTLLFLEEGRLQLPSPNCSLKKNLRQNIIYLCPMMFTLVTTETMQHLVPARPYDITKQA